MQKLIYKQAKLIRLLLALLVAAAVCIVVLVFCLISSNQPAPAATQTKATRAPVITDTLKSLGEFRGAAYGPLDICCGEGS